MESDPGENAVFTVKFLNIFGLNRYDHPAVGKGRVALGKAHAVDDDFIIFCCGRDNEAARAHAERVHSAFANFGGEVVTGCWK